jgi:tRNA(Arg) A34 adenosine deaminase TadA
MRSPQTDELDRQMMTRCIALSVRSGEEGEYPYAAVVRRAGQVVSESINRVARERDVTRHAEVVAISDAQKALGTVNLEECMIYMNTEPCAYCSYAIRESRLGRVVYSLRSPHMGGASKWSILTDEDLSNTMPEVFELLCLRYLSRRPRSLLGSWRTRLNMLCSGGIRWCGASSRRADCSSPAGSRRYTHVNLIVRVLGG